MEFFKTVGEYFQIMWQWVDYPFHVMDFTFRLWQIAMFLFVLDMIWNFIGWRVKEDYVYDYRSGRNKKYEPHERILVKRPDDYLQTFKEKEIDALKNKYD